MRIYLDVFVGGVCAALLGLKVKAWIHNKRVLAEYRAQIAAEGAAMAETVHILVGDQ